MAELRLHSQGACACSSSTPADRSPAQLPASAQPTCRSDARHADGRLVCPAAPPCLFAVQFASGPLPRGEHREHGIGRHVPLRSTTQDGRPLGSRLYHREAPRAARRAASSLAKLPVERWRGAAGRGAASRPVIAFPRRPQCRPQCRPQGPEASCPKRILDALGGLALPPAETDCPRMFPPFASYRAPAQPFSPSFAPSIPPDRAFCSLCFSPPSRVHTCTAAPS